MLECTHCESLIPVYYDVCPVCGTKLDRTRVWKFKAPKQETILDKAQEYQEQTKVVNGDIDDYQFK